jgi:hypothetical protein
MLRKISFLAILALALPFKAEAANFAVITAPPTMLSVLVLLFAGAGVVVCSQVWGSVKGGRLGKVWQLFMIGFMLLLMSRLAELAGTFEIVMLPELVTPGLMVVMTGVFVYGLLEAKKVLG